MDLRGIDLNLLVVFDALAERRSVTRAAQALGLSQPATSAALARLRKLLGDPLFVKAGTEMQPTPHAAQMIGTVHQVLGMVRDEILMAKAFDPAESSRSFTLLTPDIGEVNFLPPLLTRLAACAPQVRLRSLSLSRGPAVEALENGVADLAIGYFPDLQRAGLFQQYLLQNRHVCIVRRNHPRIGQRLTLKQFLDAGHVVARPDGREHVFEQFLQAHGWSRRVQLETAHFTTLLPIVLGSDLVATIPEALAQAWVAYGGIRSLPTPMKVPVVKVHQFWHRRMHKDAAHAWLRMQIFELFGPTSNVEEVEAVDEDG